MSQSSITSPTLTLDHEPAGVIVWLCGTCGNYFTQTYFDGLGYPKCPDCRREHRYAGTAANHPARLPAEGATRDPVPPEASDPLTTAET